MRLREIMTTDVVVASPQTSVREAAALMAQHDIGSLPVCEGLKALGQVTDRDITVRVTAEGIDPETCTVADIMSSPAIWAYEDQEVEDVARLMQDHQIRRLIVVDRDRQLCGVVALGDLAQEAEEEVSGETLREISQPTHEGRF